MLLTTINYIFVVILTIIKNVNTNYIELSDYKAFYKMHDDVENIDNADAKCKSENAKLFYPTSLQHLKDVFKNINTKSSAIWLPYTDRVTEKTFIGLEGEVLNIYINWSPNEPNDSEGKEDCIVTYESFVSNDIPCDLPQAFICTKQQHELLEKDDSNYYYFPKIDVLYKFHSNVKTWDEARSICRAENATLAMPENNKEANVLKLIFEKYPAQEMKSVLHNSNAFLGFHDIFKEGEFLTEGGTSLQYYYNTWEEKQPDNLDSGENCGSINRNGKLEDVKCTDPGLFFCQKKPPIKVQKTVYHYAANLKKSYKLHTEAKHWKDAFSICSSEDAHLAIIDSTEEKDFLMKLLEVFKEKYENLKDFEFVLIGFHDMFNEGKYTTVTGENLQTNIIKWKNTNPPLDKTKNCGAMTISEELVDYSCDTPSIFFCERYDNSNSCQSENPAKELNEYTNYPDLQVSYKFHPVPRKWNHARRFCRSQNATLAIPRDSSEADAILEVFKTNTLDSVKSIHLGFHDLFYEGEYVTDNGESLQYYYREWNDNQPNDADMSENCVSMLRNGKLEDRSCDDEAVFVCQYKSDDVTKIHTKNCYTDDPAYIYDAELNHGYKLHLNPKPWGVARSICASEGGYLAIINSQKELDFLTNLAGNTRNRIMHVKHPDHILIGFHDLFEENNFDTVKGEDLLEAGFVYWDNEPKINRDRNCGSMKISGKLSDFSCSERAIFFCEISNWQYI